MVLPCNWIFVGNRLRVSNLRWGLNEKIWKQEIPQTHVGSFSIVFDISLNPMAVHTNNEHNPRIFEKLPRKLDVVVWREPNMLPAPVEVQDCLFTRR